MIELLRIVRLGIKSLLLHKLRSFLTMLGLLFGVAAVIGTSRPLSVPVSWPCIF